MKKLFLIPLMAIFACATMIAGEFKMDVTSANSRTVGIKISDGWKFELQLPAEKELSMNAMSVYVSMTDIPALNIVNSSRQSVIMNTGLDGSIDLGMKLNKAYGFNENAKMVVSVKAEGATQSFLYNINAIDNNVIKATPSSQEEAYAAWDLFAEQVEKGNTNDSHLLIKAGSYVQFGEKKLGFGHDIDILEGSDAIKDAIDKLGYEGALVLSDGSANDEIFIMAGSQLGIAGRLVTFKENVTIVMEGGKEAMRSSSLELIKNGGYSNVINGFIAACNDFAGYVLANGVTYVTINVGEIEEGESLVPGDAVIPEEAVTTVLRDGLAAGNYYTICLPYGVNNLSGAIFYEIEYTDGTKLHLIEVEKLIAGYPYVFVPSENEIKGAYNGLEIANSPINNRGLVGTYEIMEVPYGKHVFVGQSLKMAGNKCLIAANRAYVDLSDENIPTEPQNAPGRRRMVVGADKVATAIDGVIEETPANGIKKAVVNGQLIIIRDGVKYNAQGAVVE